MPRLLVRKAKKPEKLLRALEKLKKKGPEELTSEEKRLLQRWYLTFKGSRSFKLDLSRAGKKVPASVGTWLGRPSKYDLPGVDEPGAKATTIREVERRPKVSGEGRAEVPEVAEVAEVEERVRVEFEVGSGATKSGYPIKELVWVMLPGSAKWLSPSDLGAKVDWTRISSTKRFGKVELELPVGAIVKRYEWYRKGGGFKYFLVTKEGLKELPFVEEVREVKKLDGKHSIMAKLRVIDIDGKKVEDVAAIYVKGPVGQHVQPVHSFDELPELEERFKKVGRPRAKLLFDTIWVAGDVYAVKEKLKGLGFKWKEAIGRWELNFEELEPERLERIDELVAELEGLGIDVSDVREALEKEAVRERINAIIKAKRRAREFEEKAREYIMKAVGVEPVAFYPRGSELMVKFPYLGAEKFKELRQKYRYEDGRFALPMPKELQDLIAGTQR